MLGRSLFALVSVAALSGCPTQTKPQVAEPKGEIRVARDHNAEQADIRAGKCAELTKTREAKARAGLFTEAKQIVDQQRKMRCRRGVVGADWLLQQRLSFFTRGVDPSDVAIVERTAGRGCGDLLKGQASRRMCFMKKLCGRRLHPPKAGPYVRYSHALLRKSIPAQTLKRTWVWIALQSCAGRNSGPSTVADATIRQAQQWQAANDLASILRCLEGCALDKPTRTKLQKMEAGKARVAELTREAKRLSEEIKNLQSIDRAVSIKAWIRNQDVRLKRHMPFLGPIGPTLAIQVSKQREALVAKVPKVANTEAGLRVGTLRVTLAVSGRLIRNRRTQDAQLALLDKATETALKRAESFGSEELTWFGAATAKVKARYDKRVLGHRKSWSRLRKRLLRRRARFAKGFKVRAQACEVWNAIEHSNRDKKHERKLRAKLRRLTYKVRSFGIRFKPGSCYEK